MPLPDARLAVLMFTDIVDSTGLRPAHGVAAYMDAFARHNAIFEGLAREFAGMQILQHTGDGFFASFSGVADAVRFALRFQYAMRREVWTGLALSTRVGIHAGEIAATEVMGKSNVLGPAADLTSRVMSLALGGQILLTRTPFDEARPFVREHPATEGESTPSLRWLAHGPYLLKGRDEPMDIFEVGADGFAPLSPPPSSEKAKRATRPGEEETLGWRPADGLEIPGRPGWRLVQKLGAGGFGEVWAGEQEKTRERRAFKFCFDAERLRSLKREVTLTSLMRKALGERDDIVRIYDLRLNEPPYFLESELATEGNLLQWAERHGGLAAIPMETRMELIAAAAEALAAAHSVGVLHKDVKPSNILIFKGEGGRPHPRLVDFGIGALADPDALARHDISAGGFTGLTVRHTTGTAMYTPPEYLAGHPFTVQGEIYALGVMLYQIVIGDSSRPLAFGWERDVPDEFLQADIASCVEGIPELRLSTAAELATRLRTLDARRAERDARLAEDSNRLRFAFAGVLAMLIAILGCVAVLLHEFVALPDGHVADVIVINTFSLPSLVCAFISGSLVLSVFYRYLRTTRRNTDLIFTFLLLQVLTYMMLFLSEDNIVPKGVPAMAIPGAAESTLRHFRLMFLVGLTIMPTVIHFSLRYTGTQRFMGWKASLLYAAALALSPLIWTEWFLQLRVTPLAPTSSWSCAVPFQPHLGPLTLAFIALWLAVFIYVQFQLWPHRRIADSDHPGGTRLNRVWLGITFWGVAAVFEIAQGLIEWAGLNPNLILATAMMLALALGLAREAAHEREEKRRAARLVRIGTQP